MLIGIFLGKQDPWFGIVFGTQLSYSLVQSSQYHFKVCVIPGRNIIHKPIGQPVAYVNSMGTTVSVQNNRCVESDAGNVGCITHVQQAGGRRAILDEHNRGFFTP